MTLTVWGNYNVLVSEGPPGLEKARPWESTMPKMTYQPKTRRRYRVHGFQQRMRTRGGRIVLQRRRLKGRHKLTV